MDRNKYVTASLSLHLFFARIMKEHAIFLEGAFTPVNISMAKEASTFKAEFEKLLAYAVKLSNGVLSRNFLTSGQIITEFTYGVEKQTQRFTGIPINHNITMSESRLHSAQNFFIKDDLLQNVKRLNQNVIKQVTALISFKERIINNVMSCNMFTMNYPLFIKHILREAKLYKTTVLNYENGNFQNNIKQTEQFWNQIMMEHALLIRNMLDPTEDALTEESDEFAEDYKKLLEKSKEMLDKNIAMNTHESLDTTIAFRDFKIAGVKGIQSCKIQSVILPLLADHVLREANHYIYMLK